MGVAIRSPAVNSGLPVMDGAVVRSAMRRLGRVVLPREDCVNNADSNTCEKPSSSSTMTLAIVATVIAVVVVCTAAVLLYLHLRRRRLDRREDARLAHELTDYDGDDDMMPQPPVKMPDSAIIPGHPNGRMGSGRPPTGKTEPGARSPLAAEQFASSVDTVVGSGGPPKGKDDSFLDGGASQGPR